MLTALVAAALLAPAWTPGLKAANHYADGRPGEVSFAVRTEKDVWGRGLDRQVQSASVVKALLLVAYLRQPDVRSRDLTSEERHILTPPYTPRWNGKLERFNQTLDDEWARSREWPNSHTRDRALRSFLRYYNRRRPHTSLGDRPPISRVHHV